MPNWCANYLSVRHTDPEMIRRFLNAIPLEELFSEFVPLNENGEWEYDKAVSKWGTKWEAGDINVINSSVDSVNVYFQTAWSPPIQFYEELLDMGFELSASYSEPGMPFAGVFDNGDDRCYDIHSSEFVPVRIRRRRMKTTIRVSNPLYKSRHLYASNVCITKYYDYSGEYGSLKRRIFWIRERNK